MALPTVKEFIDDLKKMRIKRKKQKLGHHPELVVFDEMENLKPYLLLGSRGGGKARKLIDIEEAQDFLDKGDITGSMVKMQEMQDTIEKYNLEPTPLIPSPNFIPSSHLNEISTNNTLITVNETREFWGLSPLKNICSSLMIQTQMNQGMQQYAERFSMNQRNILMGSNSRSPIGIEKLFNRQFRCKDCKYLTNAEVKNKPNLSYSDINPPYFYCKRGFSRKDVVICNDFKISEEILTTIHLLDMEASKCKSPELKRDLHPIYLIGGFIKVYPASGEEWKFFSGRAFPFYSRNDRERIPMEIIL